MFYRVLDKTQTAKNARHFLLHVFPDQQKISGKPLKQITSPQLTFTPPSHGMENHKEDQLVEWLSEQEEMVRHARLLTDCVADAVASIDNNEERYLIIECYIESKDKRKTDDYMADKLSIGKSTLTSHKQGALCTFAERFDAYNVNMYKLEDIEPLVIWK